VVAAARRRALTAAADRAEIAAGIANCRIKDRARAQAKQERRGL
jgi:hypothetical protein